MTTIHTYEKTVDALKNAKGKDTETSYNFLGQVYDEPIAKTPEFGDKFTKVTIHGCSERGSKKIAELVYDTMNQEELEKLINGLCKDVNETIKCLS